MAEVVTELAEPQQGSLLETAIRAANSGTLSSVEVVRTLLASKIAIPSRTEVRSHLSELHGVILDNDGKGHLAAFTTVERAKALKNMAPYCLLLDSLPVLQALDADLGLVINPGTDVVMEISAGGIRRIVQQFGTPAGDSAPN